MLRVPSLLGALERSSARLLPLVVLLAIVAAPVAAQVVLYFPGQITIGQTGENRDVLGLDYDGDGRQELVVGMADGSVLLTTMRPSGVFEVLERFNFGGAVVDLTLLAVAPGDTVLVATTTNPDEVVLIEYGAGPVPFTVRDRVPLIEDPGNAVAGPLGGDGEPGIVVSLPGLDSIALLQDDGSGWEVVQTLVSGDTPADPTLIDLEDDGVVEIVTADRGPLSEALSVYRWNAGAGYALAEQPAIAGVPMALRAFDHDLDDVDELFVAYADLSYVSIMEPIAGVLVESEQVATPIPADGMLVAPVTESDLALLCWNAERGVVHYYRRTRQQWDFTETFYTGGRASGVAFLDMNSDGFTDLAVGNGVSETVAMLFGNNLPSFRGYQALLRAGLPSAAITLDADRDGNLDVVVSDLDNAKLTVLYGLGDGRLEPQSSPLVFEAGISDIATLHADADALTDLAVVQTLADRVRVLLLQEDGTFVDHASFIAGDAPLAVAVADFDGDELTDIVVANGGTDDLTIAYGAGDGTFPDVDTLPVTGNVADVCQVDLNGDLLPDLVVTNGLSGVQTFINLGNRLFGQTQFYSLGGTASSVAVADLDGDLDGDLVVANSDGDGISFLENRSDGRLQVRLIDHDLGRRPGSIAVADIDLDGDTDVIVSFPDVSEIGIVLNLEPWSFSIPILFEPALEPGAIVVGDLNNDEIPDIVVMDRALDLVVSMLNVEPNPVPLETRVLHAACDGDQLRATIVTVDAGAWRFEAWTATGWLRLGDRRERRVGTWQPRSDGWEISITASEAGSSGLPSGATSGLVLRLVRSMASGEMIDEIRATSCWANAGDLPRATVSLSPPHPNPFNPALQIEFALTRTGPVEVAVWDLRGRRVATLLAHELPAGDHRIAWDGEGSRGPAAAGTYIVTVSSEDARVARKVSLVR